jgi:hypothetical protein
MPRPEFGYGTETETFWRYQRIMSKYAFINYVDGSREHFMQLLLLDLLYVDLSLSSRVTRKLLEDLPGMIDNHKIIEAATAHSIRVQIFEELSLVAEDMLTTFMYISKRACNNNNFMDADSSKSSRKSLSRSLEDLQLELEEHKVSSRRLIDLSNKRYALAKDVRDVNQAFRTYWLSALAAVFLPMSLACSLLSMQVRISQLHDVLYDFFGLVFILGSAVVIFGPAIRFFLNYRAWQSQLNMVSKISHGKSFLHNALLKFSGKNGSRKIKKRRVLKNRATLSARVLLYTFWLGILLSFLVGMITDVGLSLKVFGYGTAALGCLSIALFASYVLIFYWKDAIEAIIIVARGALFISVREMLKAARENPPGRKEDNMKLRALRLMDKIGDERRHKRSRSRRSRSRSSSAGTS